MGASTFSCVSFLVRACCQTPNNLPVGGAQFPFAVSIPKIFHRKSACESCQSDQHRTRGDALEAESCHDVLVHLC